ncbi:MAG: hypothetical protein HGA82_03565, partial [Anaerolineales bacterium]|nr:hypothetical protein [Anaerolineales bacterium]
VDERTNTLFVQDTGNRLEEARRLIQQLDVPVRQVMIEARIVIADDKWGRSLGARFGTQSAYGSVRETWQAVYTAAGASHIEKWKERHEINKWEAARKDTRKDLTFEAGRVDGYMERFQGFVVNHA